MARKLDETTETLGDYLLPYESDALGSLVRISTQLGSAEFQRSMVGSTTIPDDPHAIPAIYALAARGSLRPGALAALLHVSAPTASRLVEKLSCAGYVRREADPQDSRASRVALTPEGARASASIFHQGDVLMDTLLEGWSAEDRTTLNVLLERLATAMTSPAPVRR